MHLLVLALISWFRDRNEPPTPEPDYYPVSGFCDL
jgi:hypothetical protein